MIINYENIFKYFIKEHFTSVHNWRENKRRKKYERNVNVFINEYNNHFKNYGEHPLFGTIEIETINRCNSTCSFCPVNRNADTREFKLMDETLFTSIITQLKAINYKGSIGLYSNNEPFLDKRIVNFAQLTKELLPNNHLYLYTNGSLLTLEKFNAIMNYLDRIYIDNYNDKLQLNQPVKAIHNYCSQHNKYKDKVKIRLRKLNDVLTTRGGEAPNRKNETISSLSCACFLPFRQFVVRPDGKVSLCCNDALGKITLGDLSRESIKEVWNGEQYRNIRQQIITGRQSLPLCQSCDSLL